MRLLREVGKTSKSGGFTRSARSGQGPECTLTGGTVMMRCQAMVRSSVRASAIIPALQLVDLSLGWGVHVVARAV